MLPLKSISFWVKLHTINRVIFSFYDGNESSSILILINTTNIEERRKSFVFNKCFDFSSILMIKPHLFFEKKLFVLPTTELWENPTVFWKPCLKKFMCDVRIVESCVDYACGLRDVNVNDFQSIADSENWEVLPKVFRLNS